MHRSRINGILIDCNVDDIQAAARFWAEALGRPVDPDHPGTRGNYVMLETPPDEISVQSSGSITRAESTSISRPMTFRRRSLGSKSSVRRSTHEWNAGS
jgi:hypothetical protein